LFVYIGYSRFESSCVSNKNYVFEDQLILEKWRKNETFNNHSIRNTFSKYYFWSPLFNFSFNFLYQVELPGDPTSDPDRQRDRRFGERSDRASHHEEHPRRAQPFRPGSGCQQTHRECLL
jgi:hypothetical protein